jgi:hypothetical protein
LNNQYILTILKSPFLGPLHSDWRYFSCAILENAVNKAVEAGEHLQKLTGHATVVLNQLLELEAVKNSHWVKNLLEILREEVGRDSTVAIKALFASTGAKNRSIQNILDSCQKATDRALKAMGSYTNANGNNIF